MLSESTAERDSFPVWTQEGSEEAALEPGLVSGG